MMLRPYRLERELDRVVAQWLGWLPRWDPATTRPRAGACAVCPRWLTALRLEHVPHGAVHALVVSLDAVIAEHFRRSALLRHPELEVPGAIRVTVEEGSLRIEGAPSTDPLPTALSRLHEDIVQESIERVVRQRPVLIQVLDSTVEPKIRKMADELVAEVLRG